MHTVLFRAIRPCSALKPPGSRTCHANFRRFQIYPSLLSTSMSIRRPYSSNGGVNDSHSHDHANHTHSHTSNSHSHARPSIFGHSHSHSHDGDDHSHSHVNPEQLVNAFRNTSWSFRVYSLSFVAHSYEEDRGSQVTLIGLGANIVLTGTKGASLRSSVLAFSYRRVRGGWCRYELCSIACGGRTFSERLVR